MSTYELFTVSLWPWCAKWTLILLTDKDVRIQLMPLYSGGQKVPFVKKCSADFCATLLLFRNTSSQKRNFYFFQSLILTLNNGLRFSQTVEVHTNVFCVPKNLPENPTLNCIICEFTVVFQRNRQCVIFAEKYSTRVGSIAMSIWGQFMVLPRPWCVKWTIQMLPTYKTCLFTMSTHSPEIHLGNDLLLISTKTFQV